MELTVLGLASGYDVEHVIRLFYPMAKLVPGYHRGGDLVLARAGQRHLLAGVRENGVCAFEHTIRLTKIELFTYETQIAFGYEAADKKVLIVNPVPKILQKDEQTKTVPLDNGDTVGGSIVYAATGFLNALGRGRLGR